MADKSFTINRVGWHTNRLGSLATEAEVHLEFRTLAEFLQENGLTTRTLLVPGEILTDDFEISSSDLTEEGMKLVRLAYEKWLAGIDRGNDASETKILQKYLDKMRGGK